MSVIEIWHKLVKNRDADRLDDLLADDVVFHSPVVHGGQKGKALTKMYLTAALHVLGNESFRYVREILGKRDAALEFVANVDGVEINGVDFIQWNDAGKITDFKVMVRPIKAVNTIHQLMAQALAIKK